MADDPGEIIRPHRHALLVSPDRQTVGLSFDSHNRQRVTILLPLLAATDLRRLLGQILDTLGEGADGTTGTPERPN